MIRQILILLFASCLLFSCQRTKPQAPIFKNRQPDTTAVKMVLLNQRLAQEADNELTNFIKHSDTAYTLSEHGFWYQFLERTDGDMPAEGDEVKVSYQIRSLQGRILEDVSQRLHVGKAETIAAIDDMLSLMHNGERVRMLVPWYRAYGMQGNGQVEPYQNIIIDLTLHK